MDVNIYSRRRGPMMTMIVFRGMLMMFVVIAVLNAARKQEADHAQQNNYSRHFLYSIFHNNNHFYTGIIEKNLPE